MVNRMQDIKSCGRLTSEAPLILKPSKVSVLSTNLSLLTGLKSNYSDNVKFDILTNDHASRNLKEIFCCFFPKDHDERHSLYVGFRQNHL